MYLKGHVQFNGLILKKLWKTTLVFGIFFLSFLFWKCIPSNHRVKIHKTTLVLIPIWWKNGGDGVLSTMSNLYNVFHCHIIWIIRWKKTMKKKKKQRNEQPWTLVQTLVLQTMKLFFFKSRPTVFLPNLCLLAWITIWFVFNLNPWLKALGPI